MLVFEDLHWADAALLAFLEHLADWAAGVPLLLLCTARPELYEQHPTFGANARNAQRINLAPLTDTETAQLVLALLERAVLPAEIQQVLLERAGGNPLYAEEFVRLLTDRGTEHVEVPESVQALIAARLDTRWWTGRACFRMQRYWARCSGRARSRKWATATGPTWNKRYTSWHARS